VFTRYALIATGFFFLLLLPPLNHPRYVLIPTATSLYSCGPVLERLVLSFLLTQSQYTAQYTTLPLVCPYCCSPCDVFLLTFSSQFFLSCSTPLVGLFSSNPTSNPVLPFTLSFPYSTLALYNDVSIYIALFSAVHLYC
jgi:hypothetical protein